MVRSSFSILFFIRESKVRKNGNAPIEVIITINGEKQTKIENSKPGGGGPQGDGGPQGGGQPGGFSGGH